MLILEDGLHVKQKFIQISGSNTEDPAPLQAARIWYDQANGALKFSANGGAFALGVAAAGVLTALQAVIGGVTPLGTLTVVATDTNTIGLVLRSGAASPSADWLSIQNQAGTQVLARFGGSSPFFEVTQFSYGFFYNGQISTSVRMGASADTATAIPLVARGFTAQSANLFEAREIGNAIQFAIGPAGQIKTANATAATTPGSVVKKLEVFDAAGASLGYVPIYSAIT
jgi:hypothetical protein